MPRSLIFFALSLLLLLPAAAEAQGRYLQLAAQYSSSTIYHEAAALPAEDGALLLIAFRVPNDRLVFMRSREAISGREFGASFELGVQVYQDGKPIDSRRARLDHFASDFAETVDQSRDYSGRMALRLPPGDYTYELSLNDLNAERTARSHVRRVTIPDYSTPSTGRAIIVENFRQTGSDVSTVLINLGGDVPYGEDFTIAVPFSVAAGQSAGEAEVSYSLRKVSHERVGRQVREARESQRLSPASTDMEMGEFETAEPAAGGEIVLRGKVDQIVEIAPQEPRVAEGESLRLTRRAGSAFGLAVIGADGERLPNGTYVLDVSVKVGDKVTTSSTQMATHWRNMPVSLYNVDVAIDNLSFIEDRAVIREMKRGSRQIAQETSPLRSILLLVRPRS